MGCSDYEEWLLDALSVDRVLKQLRSNAARLDLINACVAISTGGSLAAAARRESLATPPRGPSSALEDADAVVDFKRLVSGDGTPSGGMGAAAGGDAGDGADSGVPQLRLRSLHVGERVCFNKAQGLCGVTDAYLLGGGARPHGRWGGERAGRQPCRCLAATRRCRRLPRRRPGRVSAQGAGLLHLCFLRRPPRVPGPAGLPEGLFGAIRGAGRGAGAADGAGGAAGGGQPGLAGGARAAAAGDSAVGVEGWGWGRQGRGGLQAQACESPLAM